MYLFMYFWLCWVFVSVRGLPLVAASGGHSSSRCAGLCRGLSCCGARAPDAQAQQLWLTGPVALRHVGSSQTRARTRVPCIGRRILNHCATREALKFLNGPQENFLQNQIMRQLAVVVNDIDSSQTSWFQRLGFSLTGCVIFGKLFNPPVSWFTI